MNVLGLWIISSELERGHGARVLLPCFLAGSLGAFALATFTMTLAPNEARVLVGGSAGLLGLVGALGTFSALGFLTSGNRTFGRRLVLVGLIVVAQLAFDWFTPMVSSFLHLWGFAFGALVALPFGLPEALRVRRAQRAC
jgi:membrane associated rhomboid family serine protease